MKSWLVVLSAALFFFYEFIQMNMFNAIDPSLMKAFLVTATQLGNLSATYFYGNVLFLFVTGIFLDRFSTRKVILTAMCVCVTCTYLFALSHTLLQAQICRFITGIASTTCMLSCVRLASRWFPTNKIALVIGLVVTFAMMGGVVAQTPMTFITNALGWRNAVMINATLGLVFAVIIFKNVQDYPENSLEINHHEKAHLKEMGFLPSIKMAIKNKQNWLAGLYTNFLSFPIVILGAAWGGLYLMHVHQLSHNESSYVTSMIFIGTILGSPFMGWLSDHLEARKKLMIIGAIFTLILILLIMLLPNLSLKALLILFFLLGFMASTQVISYPLVVESNPRCITSTAEGLTCTLIMTAGLFQLVYGWLVDLTWNGQMQAGVRSYTAHNFQLAMWMFPLVFLIALVMSFFIRETKHERYL